LITIIINELLFNVKDVFMILNKYLPILMTLIPALLIFLYVFENHVISKKEAFSNALIIPIILYLVKSSVIYFVPNSIINGVSILFLLLFHMLFLFIKNHDLSFYISLLTPIIIVQMFISLPFDIFFSNLYINVFIIMLLASISIYNFKKERYLFILGIGGIIAFITPIPLNAFISSVIIVYGIYYKISLSIKMFKNVYESLNLEHSKLIEDFEWEVKKESAVRTRELEDHKESILQNSKIDPLTKAVNKKGLLDFIDGTLNKNSVFSIIMFDIDHFKLINDNLGHEKGDKCLKQLSHFTRYSLRENDILGRYGGDEFIIVLPGQDSNMAVKIASRIREKIEKDTDPKFTLSMGIAQYPINGKTREELIEYADANLYKAKKSGRNKVHYE
jgi:diguanylate cyclase (GGDEF)-like protein